MRADVLARSPKLRAVFDLIAPRLSAATMQDLNRKVDVEGLTEEEVAADWLDAEGLVPSGAGLQGVPGR